MYTSDDDSDQEKRQSSTRKSSRISTASLTNSIGHISEDMLRIWSELPEAVRMDPSLIHFQKEYEKAQERALSGTDDDGELNPNDKLNTHERKLGPIGRYIKLALLISCWIAFFITLMITSEKAEIPHQILVPNNEVRNLTIIDGIYDRRVSVTIEGSLLPNLKTNVNNSLSRYYLSVWLESIEEFSTDGLFNNNRRSARNISEVWTLSLFPPELIDIFPNQRQTKLFQLNYYPDKPEYREVVLQLKTNLNTTIPLTVSYDASPINAEDGIAYGALVLVGLYVLIVFEIVHRTIAAMLASTSSLAILAALNEKPTMSEIISWIDVDTLLLLFSMMILVAVVADTGVFDYMAVYAYKTVNVKYDLISSGPSFAWNKTLATLVVSPSGLDGLMFFSFILKMIRASIAVRKNGTFMNSAASTSFKITGGREWPLVSTLCFFTALVSVFLDNVTTVLLMTPVTIRLCEVMQLNPVPVLTAMVIFSNIGGAMTPVGDPPNVIIASNRDVINAGVGFGTYTAHMSIGVILVLIILYGHFRFIFRNIEVLRFDEPQDVQELRHEILVWQRAAASLSSYSKEENLVRETLIKKVRRLLQQLKQKLITGSVLMDHYRTTLEELQAKYPIRNKLLLVKSGFSMILVILLFFLHSLPHFNLSLGWTSFLCVLLLLILADTEDLDGLMARVEWSTLLFFAALFVLMEALTKLGLMAWIGKKTELVILSVSEESRLAVAILLLLWVSAIAGAFVDNVPLTTMMIRIVTGLADNGKLQLPLQPLVWALAFGACMGGNGTLIGATANVVCAGVAEQHGYRFTFMQFFKMGFPVLFTSTMTITVYLMVAHVIFDWNY